MSKALLKSSKTKSTWRHSLSCLSRSSVSWIFCVLQERFSGKSFNMLFLLKLSKI